MKNTPQHNLVGSALSLIRQLRPFEFLVYGVARGVYSAVRDFNGERYSNSALLSEDAQSCDLPSATNERHIVAVEPWPFGKDAAIVVSFDDLSPVSEPGFTDFGGDLHGTAVTRFENFMAQFPHVKVTHFVPTMMSYDPIRGVFSKGSGSIGDSCFREWRSWLIDWVSSRRVEVAAHGVLHYNRDISSPAEFDQMDYGQAKTVMLKSVDALMHAGFRVTGFRPPAWGLGNSSCVVVVAKDLGLDYVAASGVGIGLNRGKKTVSDLRPSLFQGILNVPQNITLGLRKMAAHRLVNEIVHRRGLISVKGHFADSYYLAASLNAANFRWLKDFFKRLTDAKYELWFATMSEIAEYIIAISSVTLTFRSAHAIVVKNRGNSTIRGLALRIGSKQPNLQAPDREGRRILILPDILPGQAITIDITTNPIFTA